MPGSEPDANDKRSDNATADPPGDTDRADTFEPANDIISAQQQQINQILETTQKKESTTIKTWLSLPFGDRMLFLVRRPLTSLGRRIGLGAFRRPRYRAKTLNKTTPAVIDTRTTYEKKGFLISVIK